MAVEDRRILFVLTSSGNLGDLALCADWIAAFKDTGARFAFAYPAEAEALLPEGTERYPFERHKPVAETIGEAAAGFVPHAIVFATGVFWSIPGQAGVEWGKLDEAITELGIPLLTFDPFERDFTCTLPPTGGQIHFPEPPPSLWRLRYMSMPGEQPPGTRQFHLTLPGRAAEATSVAQLKSEYGFDPERPLLLYCVSANRMHAIEARFFDYYTLLSRHFLPFVESGVQLLVLGTESLPPFDTMPNTQVRARCAASRFFALLSATHVFVTDSLVSSLVYAAFAGVPSLLLTNGYASPEELPVALRRQITPSRQTRRGALARHLTLRALSRVGLWRRRVPGPHSVTTHGVYPWVVFPYGLSEMRRHADQAYALAPCYAEAPFFDVNTAAATLEKLIVAGPARMAIRQNCRTWARIRAQHPAPPDVLESILGEETGT